MCTVLIVLFTLPCLSATDIAVNEETGMDKVSCLTSEVSCASLNFVFSNLPDCHGRPLNVTIHDGTFKFTLNSTVTSSLFKNCPSVSITGNGADKTSIICGEDVGFSFNDLQSVKISSIKFIECGSIQKSNVASYINQNWQPLLRITLYFGNCKNVTLHDLLLVNSIHKVALVVNNIYERFLVEELAIFDENTIPPTKLNTDILCCDHEGIDGNCIKQQNFSWIGFTNKNGVSLFNMSNYYSAGNSGRILITLQENVSKDIIGADKCRFDDNMLWSEGLLVRFKSVYGNSETTRQNLFITNKKGIADNKDRMCPPGYYLASNETCQCSFLNHKQQLNGILSCDNDRHAARIKRGYWAGYELSKQHPTPNYTNLVTGQCPRHYCSKMKTLQQNFLPNITNITILDDLVCSPFNRTGTLCGRCLEGFAVAVNSPYYDCVNYSSWLSKHGWIFLIATEYLPSTALFGVLLFFDVDLNSGTISSIILYFQVFDSLNIYSDDDIDQLGRSNTVLKGISFLSNIWNLEFFGNFLPPYCVSPNFKTMDILLIKYISGGYAFLLFLLFIFLSKIVYCQVCGLGRIARRPGIYCTRCKFSITRQGSIVRGLATVWTLVIAKLTLISGLMLSREDLKGSKASQLGVPVAWLQGNMDWGGDEHQKYVIVAFLVLLVFVFIPVAGLLCYPLMSKFTGIIKDKTGVDLNFLESPFLLVKSLIDSFQADFRPNYEFFAGLLCCYRLAIIFVFSFTIREETFYYNTVISVIFVIITATVRPYKKQRHNNVTILCVSNIVLINLISIYLLYYSDTNPGSHYSSMQSLLVLQLVLVLLPFLYFMVFAIWRSWNKLKAWWNHDPVGTSSELASLTANNAQVQHGSAIHNDSVSDNDED